MEENYLITIVKRLIEETKSTSTVKQLLGTILIAVLTTGGYLIYKLFIDVVATDHQPEKHKKHFSKPVKKKRTKERRPYKPTEEETKPVKEGVLSDVSETYSEDREELAHPENSMLRLRTLNKTKLRRIVKLKSHYIVMRDGVKIAADVYYDGRMEAKTKRPTIVMGTRYSRAFLTKWPFQYILGTKYQFKQSSLINPMVERGYVVVFFDVRGTGSSYGHKKHDISYDEEMDTLDITKWIVVQPWSNGVVGTFGTSYDGAIAEAFATHNHKNVKTKGRSIKAYATMFSPFDYYRDLTYPGGVLNTGLMHTWGAFTRSLELNEPVADTVIRSKVKNYLFNGAFAGPPLILNENEDPEHVRKTIIAEHQKNWDPRLGLFESNVLDKPISWLTGPNKTIHEWNQRLWKNQHDAETPVMIVASWYDASFCRGAFKRFMTSQTNYKHMIIGPWTHGGAQNASPYGKTRMAHFDFTQELVSFFDYHMREHHNDTNPHYYDEEHPNAVALIRYFTVGDEAWKETNVWPPASSTITPTNLGAMKGTSIDKSKDAFDTLIPDYNMGVGKNTRWNVVLQQEFSSLRYDLTKMLINQSKMLRYVQPASSTGYEITGNAHLSMTVEMVDGTDGCLFAYLFSRNSSGTMKYITEGHLRLSHASIQKSPLADSSVHHVYDQGNDISKTAVLEHVFTEKAKVPLSPNTPFQVTILFEPISFYVKPDHELVLAIVGWDKHNFNDPSIRPFLPKAYQLYYNQSSLHLPIIQR